MDNEKTIFALKKYHLYVVMYLILSILLVRFWSQHSFGLNYSKFFIEFFVMTEGFLLSRIFIFFFTVGIFIAIYVSTCCLAKHMSFCFGLTVKVNRHLYTLFLSFVFLFFWVRETLGSVTNHESLVYLTIFGAISILLFATTITVANLSRKCAKDTFILLTSRWKL